MAEAEFRFYEELNDFLPVERRKRSFLHQFNRRSSIKDMIESFGVPHTEVELILVNGESVDFSYILRNGDRVSVYPMFESMDVTPLVRLRSRPMRKPRFVLDGHLGRLVRYMRLLGFDARYCNDCSDDELANISSREQRILLTRDRRLLHRRIVTHGYCVRNTDPRQQVSEVLLRFDLYGQIVPFARCIRCNGVLHDVDKGSVEDKLEPLTRRYYDDFKRCDGCGQIYWKGSHYQRVERMINEILDEVQPPVQ